MVFRTVLLRLRGSASLAAVQNDALAPLVQARRCLDEWLREEGRVMTPRHRQRAAALIARYFAHEEDVSDQLILSFLRHYSGFSTIDLDDPASVRQAFKLSLDRAATGGGAIYWRPWLAAVTGVLATATVLVVVYLSQQTLTAAEQDILRRAVAAQSAAAGVPPARIWADVRRATQVRRYQDIRRWDHDRALEVIKSYK